MTNSDIDTILDWIEAHKTLVKRDPIASDGKYSYGVSFVDLRDFLQGLRGGVENDKKTEERQ